jgi:hypothetical protein
MALVVIPSAASVIIDVDGVTVTGTVDGVPVMVRCDRAALDLLPTRAAKATYLAGLMKAAAAPRTALDLSGTYTV